MVQTETVDKIAVLLLLTVGTKVNSSLSVNSELNPDAEERLLTLYFGPVTKSSWARLQLMKMMSEFREGMWAVVQQAISTLDTDFVSYAKERLSNCERLAGRPEFEGWLADSANAIS